MFFDRDRAKSVFQNLKSNKNKEWITIIGDKGIGKTAFAKEIVKENKNHIYCEPSFELSYWCNFYNEIKEYAKEIVISYLKTSSIAAKNYVKYDNFVGQYTNEEYEEKLKIIIKDEVFQERTVLSKIIGQFLNQKVEYIVLDNMYLCDSSFYKWLVSLSEKFISPTNHIVTICDMDVEWKSNDVKDVFIEFIDKFTNIDINVFDNKEAYYELLSEKIYFNNSSKLLKIATNLFNEFNGDSSLIFKLIGIVVKKTKKEDTDEAKKKTIYETSSNLLFSNLENLQSLEKNILAVLAIAQMPLTEDVLSNILDHDLNNIHESLEDLANKDLIERNLDFKTNVTLCNCTPVFSNNTYINLIHKRMIFYYQQKIYALYMKGKIQLTEPHAINIIMQIKPLNMVQQINSYLDKYQGILDDEKKSDLINFIIENSTEIPISIQNIDTIDLLYSFGHYASAKKLFNAIGNYDNNYCLLMKYGDILHLTLDVDTAKTFKKASEIENITISDKLSAINRYIMAMTQQDKKGLDKARKIYRKTIEQFSNEHCQGLIELYRNSNNILGYKKSLEYTIIGYNLACDLGDILEKIKCLHNICMIELLNGTYESSVTPKGLDFKPSFKDVYDMLLDLPNFRHETAYPLLDMATNEMFHFSENMDDVYLKKAKSLYSEAQLYARSFYAKSIAEMGLLIVNSYLYKNNEGIKNLRLNLFEKYNNIKKTIPDFRVHRKILFTLSTSALITGDIDEGKKYLNLSKSHVFEGEIFRYNNLCDAFKMHHEKLSNSDVKLKKATKYNSTIKFVPWLISFGH